MRSFVQTIKFATVAYLLNFFWESWHAYYLYWGYQGKSFSEYSIPEYLTLIGKVSLVDAGILTAIFLGGLLIWKDWNWFEVPRQALELKHCCLSWSKAHLKLVYFLSTAIGVAVWIEIKGVYLRQEWSYLPAMPTVFGLGLSPLLQLAATGGVAIWVSKK